MLASRSSLSCCALALLVALPLAGCGEPGDTVVYVVAPGGAGAAGASGLGGAGGFAGVGAQGGTSSQGGNAGSTAGTAGTGGAGGLPGSGGAGGSSDGGKGGSGGNQTGTGGSGGGQAGSGAQGGEGGQGGSSVAGAAGMSGSGGSSGNEGGSSGSSSAGASGGGDGGASGAGGGGGAGGVAGAAGAAGEGGGGAAGGPPAVCQPGLGQFCYSGPPGTQGVGACKAGYQACKADGSGYGPCEGEVTPTPETCATAEDDDCDGSALTCTGINEACNPQSGLCEDACSPGALGSSYLGCEFFPVVTANAVDETVFHFGVLIASQDSGFVDVTITRGGSVVASEHVGGSMTFKLPWDLTLKGPHSSTLNPPAFPGSVRVNGGAYRVVTSRPVAVYQLSPMEAQIGTTPSRSADTSMLLPSHTWRTSYRVASMHHYALSSGFVSITAREDGTKVNVIPGAQAALVKPGIAELDSKGGGAVVMNAGDVIQLVTNSSGGGNGDPNDLSGMLIASDKPVQVIGGHECVNMPIGYGTCDHLEESMPPIDTLSTRYIVTPPASPKFPGVSKGQNVRIVATADSTQLTYDPPQPGFPQSIAQAGGWVDIEDTTAVFQITASHKVLVAQYMLAGNFGATGGDPSMTIVAPVEQFRTAFAFPSPLGFPDVHFVNIIAPAGATLTLDGKPIEANVAVGSTAFVWAQVPITLIGGRSRVTSSLPASVQTYGYGDYVSYACPGGFDLATLP